MKLRILTSMDEYKPYTRNVRNDAGYDLFVEADTTIPPLSVATLSFGVRTEALSGDENVAYFLLPRSSISNTPLMLANSVGLIDSGYRGEIMAKVRNFSSVSYRVAKGTRLFQLVPMDGRGWDSVEIAESLSSSERGEGGFGSTGK
jgi:dUTP pyrophosphatase